MGTWYQLEPEVPGGWGEATVADTSVHPPKIRALHIEFAGWIGSELLEVFPAFLVSERLASIFIGAGLTGFDLDEVRVSPSPEYASSTPFAELPRWRWLRVVGEAGQDDFGISGDHLLVVSKRARALLDEGALAGADVEEWDEPT